MLEEMPAFPDKESSLLNKLYETAPWTAKVHHETGPAEPASEPTEQLPVANEPMMNIGQPVDTLINTSKTVFVGIGNTGS